ncbi:hypothetical protein [Amphibacillus cookii]|uniref:hypothetical protein n=1 Tax=Amphibacillus cookii TaxID=767787 RepID=UPI00195C7655|nr:hypothetical protein [Amphibacillus cookii]MBM7543016.1 hypothetical protein [Amphibacillus cookii]
MKNIRNNSLIASRIINWFVDPYKRIKQEITYLNERKKATTNKGNELKIYHLMLFQLALGLAYSILIYNILHVLIWSLFEWYVIFFEIVIIGFIFILKKFHHFMSSIFRDYYLDKANEH